MSRTLLFHMRGRTSAEERARRISAAVVVNYAGLVQDAAASAPFDAQAVALSALSGQLDVGVGRSLSVESSVWAHPAPLAAVDADDGVRLFERLPPSVVPRMVPVPAPEVVVLQEAPAPPRAPITRAQWAKDAFIDADDEQAAPLYDTPTDVGDQLSEPGDAIATSLAEVSEEEELPLFSTAWLAARPAPVPREFRRRVEPTREERAVVCVDGAQLVSDSLLAHAGVPSYREAVQVLPALATVIPWPGESPPSPDRPRQWHPREPQHRRWVFQTHCGPEPPEVSARQLRRHPGRGRKRAVACRAVRIVGTREAWLFAAFFFFCTFFADGIRELGARAAHVGSPGPTVAHHCAGTTARCRDRWRCRSSGARAQGAEKLSHVAAMSTCASASSCCNPANLLGQPAAWPTRWLGFHWCRSVPALPPNKPTVLLRMTTCVATAGSCSMSSLRHCCSWPNAQRSLSAW